MVDSTGLDPISPEQLVFVASLPILLLVWAAEDGVMWYHSWFVLPAIAFAAVVMTLGSTQPYGMVCHRIRIIQW